MEIERDGNTVATVKKALSGPEMPANQKLREE
jgi:hypothetical protein